MLRGGLGAALALLFSACGGGEAPPSGNSCSLSTAVFGGTTIQIDASEPTTCATLNSTGAGVWGSFTGPNNKGKIELDIDNVTEGQTGKAYPSTVIVEDAAANRWRGNCLAEVTEHKALEVQQSTVGELRHYQLAGTVACSNPLTPLSAGSSETVFVDRLEFRTQVSWRN